jgi:mono/diheme cytochrome c family protein
MSYPHHSPVDPDKPVNPDFEDKDLHLGTIQRFMVGTFAFALVFFVLMFVTHKLYKAAFLKERGVATERHIPGKDQPLLQADERIDLVDYFALERARLNSSTNLGETAVIPVDAAMALMIRDHAFPIRGAVASIDVPTVKPPEPPAPAPAAAPSETQATPPAAPAQPVLDPAQVAAGKKIWEINCTVCHTGQKGAIGPNIHNAFGTIRKLEGGREILMDDAYVLNSLNNPMDDVAKGYVPAMNSFKEILTEEQELAVVAYLKSEGQPLPVPTPVPTPAAVAEAPAVPDAPAATSPATAEGEVPPAEATPAPAPSATPKPGRISA